MSPARTRDRGMTLIEMILVIAIIGVIATALAAAITVFVRNEGSVSSRLTNTRDLQNFSNFLPGDLASARVVESEQTADTDDAVTVTANLCGPGLVDDVLLHLEWNELWTAQYSARVTYRIEPNSAAPERVVRYECQDLLPPSSFTVARAFDTVTIDLPRSGSPSELTGTVEVRLTYPDGESKRVTATSRHFLP